MRKAGGFLLAIVSAALTIRLDCALGQVFALTDLGKLLHTQRLLQAGDQGQGVRIGVISGGASNYAALARRGVPSARHRALRGRPESRRRGRLDDASRASAGSPGASSLLPGRSASPDRCMRT